MTTTESTDVYYDPYDVDIVTDPYPVYARLREEAPIYYNDRYDFWAISRHADDSLDEVARAVEGVAHDDDVAALRRVEPVVDLAGDQVVLVLDGRRHGKADDVDCLDCEVDHHIEQQRQDDHFCNFGQDHDAAAWGTQGNAKVPGSEAGRR